MANSKGRSIPARREAWAHAAGRMIERKSSHSTMQDRKSYAITGKNGESGTDIPFFGKRDFGRG